MDEFGKDRIVVDWKPFIIDPGTQLEGESVESYCQRRWGGSGWTQHLITEGRQDGGGGGARFENWQVWPNTWKAHQFIQYCCHDNPAGISTDIVNQVLFRAEYEEGRNISLVETLVELAQTNEELGMMHLDPAGIDALRRYLTEDQGKARVESEIRSGRSQYGIRSVPFFVVRGNLLPRPYRFSGAQSKETFLEIFEKVANENDDGDDDDDDGL